MELPRPTVDTLIEHAGVEHVLPAEASPPRLSHFEPVGDVCEDDVALMLTTSGSTGLPKVVPITFGAINASPRGPPSASGSRRERPFSPTAD